ncbi:MAG: hypothetical protein MRY57_01475 [Candidatus Pacebacteria bacterium]|nr:hypothetical protein [Candidatus Paceibacterota bacterium]
MFEEKELKKRNDKILSEIQRLFPEDTNILNVAESNPGKYQVGKFLRYHRAKGVDNDIVLESNNLDKVKEHAQRNKDINEVWSLWYHTHEYDKP